jgi:large subunit ribosomal protein L9
MDVILLQDVDNVGLRGEVVSVARGFARNYLLPRKLAETATPARVAELERRETQRARHDARTIEQAREIAGRLEKTELRFDVKAGPTGALFGSVTTTDVADELWSKAKIRVDRRKIDLPEPLKRIGRYSVPVDVFQDVRVEVKTLVVPEGGELPPEEELEAAAAAEAAASSRTLPRRRPTADPGRRQTPSTAQRACRSRRWRTRSSPRKTGPPRSPHLPSNPAARSPQMLRTSVDACGIAPELPA